MSEQHTVELSIPEIEADNLGYFRWGRIAGQVLVTNDAAEWAFFSEDEFAELITGKIGEGHSRFDECKEKGLVREGFDLDGFALKVAQRNRHVRRGPYLHILTLTRRSDGEVDMSSETAQQIADLALHSMSPAMTFLFQGDGADPLQNFTMLKELVETVQDRNTQTVGKTLRFVVASNLTAMTEEIAEWMISHDVILRTDLDGPAKVHDANRETLGGVTHADAARWIEHFNKRYVDLGRDPKEAHVDVRLAVTRNTLEAARAVVDEYVERGIRTIHLQPLSAARFDDDTWASIGYSADEYLGFYRNTLDYILELNGRGVDVSEGTATAYLTKILTTEDPGIVDLQSPNGAGTCQLAYDVDGRVFPCEEARVLAAAGDSSFELGPVNELSCAEIVRHPTVRALAAASLLDAQPMWADCWYKPFSGVSAVRTFIEQGDIFGQRHRSTECRGHEAILTHLFEKLANQDDTSVAEVLKRWAETRPPLADDRRLAPF